jgi:hypothetical protein
MVAFRVCSEEFSFMLKLTNLICNAILITLFLWVDGHPVWGDDVSASKEKVVADYKKALVELESHFTNISGSGRLTDRRNIGSSTEITRISTVEFARSSEQAKIATTWISRGMASNESAAKTKGEEVSETAPRKDPSVQTARCYNKEFALDLERATTDKPYAVKYFGADIEPIKSQISRLLNKYWNCPTNAHDLRIASLLLLPNLSIERVTESRSPAGKRLLKIDYFLNPEKQMKKTPNALQSGSWTVSPEEHWILYAYELRFPTSAGGLAVTSGHIEYDGQDGGVPIPKRVTSRRVGYVPGEKPQESQGKLVFEETFEFAKFNIGSVPESEFTPAAFGISEISKPGRKSYANQTAAWFIGLALVAFVAAIVFRYYARRSRAVEA